MKHALYSGSANLYGDMQTAAKSLIANSDVRKVWLLTEGEYDYILPDMCEVVDVSGIWDMPIDDCYFSASREDMSCYKGMLYCNTGVTLYNLEKLRDGKAQEVVDALNWRTYVNIEQDVFSFLCQGHIHDMPSEYNATRFTDRTNLVRINHYAGIKTEIWRNEPLVQQYRQMSWDRVMELHEEKVGKNG